MSTPAAARAAYDGLVAAQAPNLWLKGDMPAWPGSFVNYFTDSSGNGFHSSAGAGGAVYRGLTPAQSWMPSGFGIGAATDAASYIQFPATLSTAGDFTIEFWLRRTGANAGGSASPKLGTVISKGGGSNNDLIIYIDAALQYVTMLLDGGTDNYFSVPLPPIDQPCYCVWVASGATMITYSNGALNSSQPITTARTNSGSWRLGDPVHTFFGGFTGTVNHLALYAATLTADDVKRRWLTGARAGAVY